MLIAHTQCVPPTSKISLGLVANFKSLKCVSLYICQTLSGWSESSIHRRVFRCLWSSLWLSCSSFLHWTSPVIKYAFRNLSWHLKSYRALSILTSIMFTAIESSATNLYAPCFSWQDKCWQGCCMCKLTTSRSVYRYPEKTFHSALMVEMTLCVLTCWSIMFL